MIKFFPVGRYIIVGQSHSDISDCYSLLSFQMAVQGSALEMVDVPWIKMVGTVCVRLVGVGQAATLSWKCFVETTWTMMEVSYLQNIHVRKQ